MESNTPISNSSAEPEQDEGINVIELLRSLWDGRKTILISLGVCVVIGLVAALTMKRTYSVSTVMVPQTGAKSSGSLGSLAAMAGIDLSSPTTNDLSPLIYPQIVHSVPFCLDLMHTPMHYANCDTLISMYDYAESEYDKPSFLGTIKRYTIGLPGVIVEAVKGKPEEKETVESADGVLRPVVISDKEQKLIAECGKMVQLSVDKKEGYLTLVVNGNEPVLVADMALRAQQLLQDEVTRLRVEKSQSELDYIEARYNEIKQENDRCQEVLAALTDQQQSVSTARAKLATERARAKYNISNAVYNEMAKQLEQAKMQVKKDTPIFTVIEPVTVPMKPSNSRAKTLAIWIFLGIVVGCGIVLAKGYWPKLKTQFAKSADEEAQEQ